ncbi:DedA family protein [Desulfolucanica intricata]|uniref:DedA family protein n=1 Tax=Desulfolucanica intricata TaxID=1285191 RepID=UPI00135209A1|nr:VTT domain-containing protein [Desulfolucanica intricata]
MIEIILNWLKDIGLVGLFATMFLEGSSLPFPGIAVVIAYGYILPFKYFDIIWVAAGMSFVYCMASLIPYGLGIKFEGLFGKYPKKGLQKAKDLFVRYGYWSVAISRPFLIGNYISYVAGMSKMRLKPYLFLTFIGIYPWSLGMILLGKYFNGSYEAFRSFYLNNSVYLYIALIIIISLGIIFLISLSEIKKSSQGK